MRLPLGLVICSLLVTTALAWPGRVPSTDPRGYDVLHYDLDLELTALPPATPRIEGRAAITLRLLDPRPAELRLDLVDDLAASDLLWQGAPTPFTQGGDSLRVTLPPGTSAGDTVTVTVAYAGSPPRHGTLWAGFLMREREGGEPSVGNVNQPYSSHSWFPCKDHPADKATVAVTVTAPDSLTVVATGRLLGRDGDTWRFATDYPVATYLVGLVASPFESWHEDCDGTPLEYHAFAEHLDEAQATFDPTCDMLVWLEDLLGPYPFPGEKYAQAEFVWGGAMENQTVTAFGQASLLQAPRESHRITVHELAHHWFGNSLTPERWRDIWLNEGLARYVELLWREHTEGPDAYRELLHVLRPDDLFVGDGLLGDPDPVLPNSLVYDKGAWVVHLLRLQLGDEAFFRFLADYASDPALVHAHTDRATFTEVASRNAGEDLTAFLAPWLDTDQVPLLGVRWQGTRVEVVQEQGSPFFPLTVPVRVHAGAEVVDLTLRMDGILAGRDVATAAAIDSAVVDPDGLLLALTTTAPLPGIEAADPRPNPAMAEVRLAYRLAGADVVTAAVYDVRGRLVQRLELGARPAGEGQWIWDGRDQGGRRAAAGVYWLELRTPSDRTVRKVTLLR